MSTRIYEGFRIKTDSIGEVLAILTRLRLILEKNAELRASKVLAEESVRILDQRILYPERGKASLKAVQLQESITKVTELLAGLGEKAGHNAELTEAQAQAAQAANLLNNGLFKQLTEDTDTYQGSPLYDAERKIRKRQAAIRSTRYRDPDVDYEVKICCRHHKKSKSVLGYVVAEDSGFAYNQLLQFDEVEDFKYQNSSDPDEDVSPADWAQREKFWNEVLKSKALIPFEFTFDEGHFWPNKELIFENLPSLESRCKEYAHDQLFNSWFLENGPKDDTGEMLWEKALRYYLDFKDELKKDPVLAERLAVLKADIAAKLPEGEKLQNLLTESPSITSA